MSGKSDKSIVPEIGSNNAGAVAQAAETKEGSDLTKGNLRQQSEVRTQCRAASYIALERVRQVSQRSKAVQVVGLWHQ